MAETKRCASCGQVKPLGEFGKHASTADRRETRCNECGRDRAREYARRDDVRERRRVYMADYWKRNPERRRANLAKEDPGRVRQRCALKRARRRAARVEDVHPLIVLELDDGVCGICGKDVDPFAFDMDHIVPLALGGEHRYANVQPAHPLCNRQKGAKLSV